MDNKCGMNMYKEIKANIWDFKDDIKIITTNGNIGKGNRAVMGKGLALDAAQRCKTIQEELAYRILLHGNHCYYFPQHKIITFPTKVNFWEKSNLSLIRMSMKELYLMCCKENIHRVIFPHVGCQNGGLNWKDVKRKIEEILQMDEVEFIIVEK